MIGDFRISIAFVMRYPLLKGKNIQLRINKNKSIIAKKRCQSKFSLKSFRKNDPMVSTEGELRHFVRELLETCSIIYTYV